MVWEVVWREQWRWGQGKCGGVAWGELGEVVWAARGQGLHRGLAVYGVQGLGAPMLGEGCWQRHRPIEPAGRAGRQARRQTDNTLAITPLS